MEWLREAIVGFLALALVAIVSFATIALMVEQNGVILQGSKTYNQTKNIEANLTGGTAGFFVFSGTYMTILGISTIIIIIGVLIAAIYKFSFISEVSQQE